MAKIEEIFPEALPEQLNADLQQIRHALTQAQRDLTASVHKFYRAEKIYRRKKAESYLRSKGQVDVRKAAVDLECNEQMFAAHLAEGLMKAAFENIRSLRAQLSAIQTEASNTRTDLELALATQSEV